MPDSPWWRRTVVYQIYPRSFCDGDGDGLGDLSGVIAKLDYLAELGVETIWLSPFYPGPQRDLGYDISDFCGVAPEYGDLETCDALIAGAHRRGLKVVLDLVLNHTSDEHPWFRASRASRDSPQRDWYVWADGRRPGGQAPPNNWRSMIGGRGWHYDPPTDQWYWAQFLPCQPDLNYRHPAVREAMFGVVRFWLERGVDGFRLDIINALFEDPQLRDNPFAWTLLPSDEDLGMLFRSTERSLNHPDTLRFVEELRACVDGFDGRERFLVGEVVAATETARRYCGAEGQGLNLVFLFESLNVPLEASRLRRLIERYEAAFPPPLLPTWVFSNHDRIRRIAHLGGDLERAKLNAALQLTARGVPFIYYGEELGMEPAPTPARESRDALARVYGWLPQLGFDLVRRLGKIALNRDESRAPMQWDTRPHAGFCPPSATPWLPLSPSWRQRNVAVQREDPESLFRCYQRFLALRRETPALHAGSLELLDAARLPRRVLGYRRRAGEQTAAVLLNASPRAQRLAWEGPEAPHLSTRRQPPEWAEGTLRLRPWEGLVLL